VARDQVLPSQTRQLDTDRPFHHISLSAGCYLLPCIKLQGKKFESKFLPPCLSECLQEQGRHGCKLLSVSSPPSSSCPSSLAQEQQAAAVKSVHQRGQAARLPDERMHVTAATLHKNSPWFILQLIHHKQMDEQQLLLTHC